MSLQSRSEAIGVTRILQRRGFTWCGPGQEVLGMEVPQKLKQNVKLVYNVCFPVENLGFNGYRSRAWTVYFANTQFKIILKIQWGVEPLYPSPFGYASVWSCWYSEQSPEESLEASSIPVSK